MAQLISRLATHLIHFLLKKETPVVYLPLYNMGFNSKFVLIANMDSIIQ